MFISSFFSSLILPSITSNSWLTLIYSLIFSLVFIISDFNSVISFSYLFFFSLNSFSLFFIFFSFSQSLLDKFMIWFSRNFFLIFSFDLYLSNCSWILIFSSFKIFISLDKSSITLLPLLSTLIFNVNCSFIFLIKLIIWLFFSERNSFILIGLSILDLLLWSLSVLPDWILLYPSKDFISLNKLLKNSFNILLNLFCSLSVISFRLLIVICGFSISKLLMFTLLIFSFWMVSLELAEISFLYILYLIPSFEPDILLFFSWFPIRSIFKLILTDFLCFIFIDDWLIPLILLFLYNFIRLKSILASE